MPVPGLPPRHVKAAADWTLPEAFPVSQTRLCPDRVIAICLPFKTLANSTFPGRCPERAVRRGRALSLLLSPSPLVLPATRAKYRSAPADLHVRMDTPS